MSGMSAEVIPGKLSNSMWGFKSHFTKVTLQADGQAVLASCCRGVGAAGVCLNPAWQPARGEPFSRPAPRCRTLPCCPYGAVPGGQSAERTPPA